MKRSLFNSLVAVSLLSLSACAGASGGGESSQADSTSEPVLETNTTPADTPVAAADTIANTAVTVPVQKTPEEKKEGKAISHSSEDDRLLDSIKKAKAKDKTPRPQEIHHGSENDALLDSIKQAKRKSKG